MGLPALLIYTEDKAYLTANDGIHGEEFWQTDGTGPGTAMIQDVNVTPTIAANSDMQFAAIASNNLYLFGTDGNNATLTDFFRVDAPLVALPLRWISFDARPSNDDVLLTWETAQEEQTDHFIVQRSGDGQNDFDLGRVNAHGIGSNQYSFTDLDAMKTTGVKKWFYRVKYVDKDAKSALSRTATISLASIASIYITKPHR
jgi:ELWxxDGT repeat protein